MDLHSMWTFIIWAMALSLFFKSPIPKAIAESIRAKHDLGRADDPAVGRQIEALRGEMEQMREDVMDLAERLDFTERMLADVRRRGALPG